MLVSKEGRGQFLSTCLGQAISLLRRWERTMGKTGKDSAVIRNSVVQVGKHGSRRPCMLEWGECYLK